MLLLFCLQAYAQQNITEVIDSLHTEYTLYPEKEHHIYDTIPPPPPLGGYINCEDCYIEAYAIPTEVILQYYPWNADSITIAFDLHDLENSKEIKLKKEDIEQIVNILYKFEYDSDKPCIRIISVVGSGSPYPNFRLTFYHKEESFFADFYRHMDNPMRIIDSSCGDPYKFITNAYSDDEEYESLIYWGSLFHITFDQLADYIEERFGRNVRNGKYENDFYEETPLMDLIERTPDQP